jgi:hypothetical protein
MNELTTVAAVWALAPFMSSYSSIGSGSADAAALASAFTLERMREIFRSREIPAALWR